MSELSISNVEGTTTKTECGRQSEGGIDHTTMALAASDLEEARRLLARSAPVPETAEPRSPAAVEPPVTTPNPAIINGTIPCSLCPEPDRIDNSCGQVAIGTALSAHGIPFDLSDLQRMNPAGIFTAPATIVSFLDDRCGAIQHNNGTLDDLRKQLDAGNPLIVLVDCGGTPHWVTVTGYTADPSGRVTGLEVTDHVIGCPSRTLAASEFERIWNAPLTGVPGGDLFTNYRNLWIQTGTRGDVIRGGPFSTATEDLVASAINKVVAGWRNVDLPKLFSGLAEGLWGLSTALHKAPFRLLESLGETLADWGTRRLKEGGVWNCLAGGAGWAAGSTMEGLAKATSAVCDGLSTIGRGVGRAVEKAGNLVASLWPF